MKQPMKPKFKTALVGIYVGYGKIYDIYQDLRYLPRSTTSTKIYDIYQDLRHLPRSATSTKIYDIRSQPYGGSDKSSNGHCYDSIPFANGMIMSGMSCQLISYVHDEHAKFFEVCKGFDALVVRCNPGQIKADGGSQAAFDDGMRGLSKLGIQVWPSADVM
eukprot:10772089-Heterocapsa_arctica.AAC.1